MKYDCGTLAFNPRQSAIYRYISDKKVRRRNHDFWPVAYQRELCIFLHTPGIAERWVSENLSLPVGHIWQYKRDLLAKHPDCGREAGKQNMYTATYDDAVRYVSRSTNRRVVLPMWAVPFFLEDVKRKVPHKQIKEIWGDRYSMRHKNFF